MNVFFETLENLRNNPLKSLITFLSLGIGVGILIFALSISTLFTQLLDTKVNAEGVVYTVSNTELQADGTYERVRPAELDMQASNLVTAGVSGATEAAVLMPTPFNQVTTHGQKYQLRTVVGTSEAYLDVMDLDLLSGLPMTESDVDNGSKKMWLSESTAILLFGSADSAIDQQVQTPARTFGPRNNNATQAPTLYTIAGVYEDADELKRTAYGIADIIVPYTAAFQGGDGNVSRMLEFIASTFVVKVADNDNADAQIRDVLTLEYGDDISLNIWEGTMQFPSTTLQETRDSVQSFTLVINLLGFILLVSGAIGILSIMLVEILGKRRAISLERALGASIPAIVQKFFMQSLVLSGISAMIGIALAYFFAAPLTDMVAAVFNGLEASELGDSLIQPIAIGVGVCSALLFGGVFGVLPLISLAKRPIAEGLRDA
jgi:ABC-type antimicrobial peptide transport system permease subunit